MLDIKFIRENTDLIKEAVRKKRMSFNVDSLIKADELRLSALSDFETLKAEQNVISGEISRSNDPVLRASLIEKSQSMKEELKNREERLREVMKEWQSLMLRVPNIPDMSVPDGESDKDNLEIKSFGEAKTFSFEAKNHIDLMNYHQMVDFERGTKVAGFRGYFLKGDGARLSYAIWRYAQDFFEKKDFTPMIVPSMVRKEAFLGTGYLPDGIDDLYKTQDDDFLAGTAEVATMAYFMDEVILKEKLPQKFISFSPCFRREAGSHSKDIKGLIRVHEFYKLEQVILCEASHSESVKWHDWLNRNTEEFIETLGIPYRTVVNCGGDLGLGQVKKYDIELWVPAELTYREISSASYFHDFQTRRLNIRYKDEDGSMKFAHSLNSTAIPTPRILVSLVENFQQEDGSIKIPDVLVPYFGKDSISR